MTLIHWSANFQINISKIARSKEVFCIFHFTKCSKFHISRTAFIDCTKIPNFDTIFSVLNFRSIAQVIEKPVFIFKIFYILKNKIMHIALPGHQHSLFLIQNFEFFHFLIDARQNSYTDIVFQTSRNVSYHFEYPVINLFFIKTMLS